MRFGTSNPDFFLEDARKARGVTQAEMADAIGISERHYRRLERDEIFDPGVRLLHNCAHALGYDLYGILSAQYFHWTTFAPGREHAPEWESFFRPERAERPDLKVSVAGDMFWIESEWLDARLEGLTALTAAHDLPMPEPLLGIATRDWRLDGSMSVLARAATRRGRHLIRPEDLLLAIAESDDGVAGALLDELGVREAIIERLDDQSDDA